MPAQCPDQFHSFSKFDVATVVQIGLLHFHQDEFRVEQTQSDIVNLSTFYAVISQLFLSHKRKSTCLLHIRIAKECTIVPDKIA